MSLYYSRYPDSRDEPTSKDTSVKQHKIMKYQTWDLNLAEQGQNCDLLAMIFFTTQLKEQLFQIVIHMPKPSITKCFPLSLPSNIWIICNCPYLT